VNEGIRELHRRLQESDRNSFVDFSGHRDRFHFYAANATHIDMCMAWYDPEEDRHIFGRKHVRIILNNGKDLHNRNHFKRQRLDELCAQIRVHHDPKQTMHCKFVVFNNSHNRWQWVWHGSYNMTSSGDRGIDQMTTSIDYDLAYDFSMYYMDLWHKSAPL
jgi:hypothetical protein